MTTTSQQWIHMVGIAGAGMSGIATVLVDQGFKVSGSDLQNGSSTKKLKELGIEVFNGHSSSNLKEGVDLLVISSAIPQDNVELELARKREIPVLKRGQMLANLINIKKGIAIAGAHGKTTTTSMIYTVLSNCGLDPSFIVGGELQDSQLNARTGESDLFIAEADESDASFLDIKPYIAVVTNIEDDHLDYYKSFDNIKNAFKQFVDGVSPEGFALLCGEDNCNQAIRNQTQGKVILYGEDSSNDYCLKNWQSTGLGSVFAVFRKNEYLGDIELSVPGKHNALNALAAVALGLEMALDFKEIKEAIKRFSGTKRRFEILGKRGRITVVDDYAHHPTEIAATINAAKYYHDGRILVIFQPHRYSRTKIMGRELGKALAEADSLVVTEVYAAGEKNIPGISGKLVFEAAKNANVNTEYIPVIDDIAEYLIENVQENDLIITMGAGDIWKLGSVILERLPESDPEL